MSDLTTQNNLIHLDELTPATMPVAILSKEPHELMKEQSLQFSEGYDDLDYVTFSEIILPSGHRVALVRHKNSPNSGIEICVAPDAVNIPETLVDVLQFLTLSRNSLTWIHPTYSDEVSRRSLFCVSKASSTRKQTQTTAKVKLNLERMIHGLQSKPLLQGLLKRKRVPNK